MSPVIRRILQAVLYELFAVLFVGPVLSIVFETSFVSSLGLSVFMSTIALGWNYVFNWLFERWESRQARTGRGFRRRLAHGLGFEGGLAVMLVPVMAYWLEISFWEAFIADLGILVFFFVYAIVFTWVFDRVLGLPSAAGSGNRHNDSA